MLPKGATWAGATVLATLVVVASAGAMPILMDRYNEHPLALARNRDDCVICHVNADGSGALTAFGKKYDRVGLEFTDPLVRQYPNLFDVDGSGTVAADSDAASDGVGFIVPGNEVVPFDSRSYYLEECTECHGKYGEGDPFQGVPSFATADWLRDRGGEYGELLIIILEGKDKMKAQAGKITEAEARELLDLVLLIAEKYQ